MSPDRIYFDDHETRSAEQRREAQWRALREQLGHARKNSRYWGALLRDVEPETLTGERDLAALPVTRKSELVERQRTEPPFGGLEAGPTGAFSHVFQSPGPIYEASGPGDDAFGFGRSLWAAGARPGQLIHNTFSYHLTPAGMMVESGARAVGCAVFPGGTGNTELQLDAMERLRPQFYGGTPSFLKLLLEKGRELGRDVGSIKRALVGAEPFPPSLRASLREEYGVFALQNYGTADVGLIAYESEAMEGMILDEDVIVEIVRPGSGDPVPAGEVGEVVVTVLRPSNYPMIRFATGDLSAFMPGQSPCGRTAPRIRGWMGRANQTTKVKGMFVTPEQVNEVAARHPEALRARLVVTRENDRDLMTLQVETERHSEDLVIGLTQTLQSVTKLRGHVALVAPGSLPNDGKVIVDERSYD
jgi:phenylacetate-CoA ligase